MSPFLRSSLTIASTLLALGSSALPRPAPQAASYRSDPPDLPTALTQPGPPRATGSLYGSSSLIGYSSDEDVNTETAVIPSTDFTLAPGQSADADLGFYIPLDEAENPQPIRGGTDSPTDPGPRTMEYEILNSDLYAPPGTDMGSVSNAKWPLGLSHNRHGSTPSAGWARQQNNGNLPSAVAMAGVDMRLSPNAYRELHWHQANEWSYILNGSATVAAVNDQGQSYIDELRAGDVWFFPAGMPHSIQASELGVEFLLIFDQGNFDESGTSLVSEMFERNPKSVLAKNLRTDVSSFDDLPTGQLYIFPGTNGGSLESQRTVGPGGEIPKDLSYSYHWSEQTPYTVPGGSVKLIDSASFPIANNFAAALVTVEPGAMRELHWHPTSDEWNYFLQGQARITIYEAPASSGTFDFSAGDVGYIPATASHYIENTGNETVVFLEMLQAPRFTDISVGQWLGLTPPNIVKETLNLPQSLIANLPKVKPYILPGNRNLTTTNFTQTAL